MATTITPSLGSAPLFTQQGVGTSPGYSAIDDRRASTIGLQEGVKSSFDFLVEQRGAGANMSVDIDSPSNDGYALVQGDSVIGQGLYVVPFNSATINEAIATADVTNPRVDSVILEVLDNVHDASGSNLARIRVLTGTPTSGATLSNRTGAAALPASSLLLADVLVGAGVASVDNTKIRDRRKWARGAYVRISRGGGNYTATSSTPAEMDTTNLKPRVECGGGPVRVILDVDVSSAVASKAVVFDLFQNGAALHLTRVDTLSAAGSQQRATISWELGGIVGSLQLAPAMGSVDNSTTMSALASSTEPLTFTVQEFVRQNTANNNVTSG